MNQILKPERNEEKKSAQTCNACGGMMKRGETTFTADLGSGVVVVRNVPATVCTQCGMDWIDDAAAKIEEIVADAKEKHSTVEVLSLSV